MRRSWRSTLWWRTITGKCIAWTPSAVSTIMRTSGRRTCLPCATGPSWIRGRGKRTTATSTTLPWTETSAASLTELVWPWQPWTSSSCTGVVQPTSWMLEVEPRPTRSRRPLG
uniref:Putative secreted protein n=1 Tax=Ixodes ricinus TaxID=34613 RepID=A0A6B0UKB1_IXORI